MVLTSKADPSHPSSYLGPDDNSGTLRSSADAKNEQQRINYKSGAIPTLTFSHMMVHVLDNVLARSYWLALLDELC